jgi:hypothetical protein
MNVSAINITKSQQIDGSPDMVSSSILPKANKQLLMNTIFPS